MLSGSSSTRNIGNKLHPISTKSSQKAHQNNLSSGGSHRFFKKMTSAYLNDQNEKNGMNYLEKIMNNKAHSSKPLAPSSSVNNVQPGSALTSSSAYINKQSSHHKNKKSTVNISLKQHSKTVTSSTDLYLYGSGNGKNVSHHQSNKQNVNMKSSSASSKDHHIGKASGVRKDRSAKALKLSSNSVEFPKLLHKSISQTTVNKKAPERIFEKSQTTALRKNMSNKSEKRLPAVSNSVQPFQNIKISQFRLGKKLGSGRFGNVYIAQQKDSHLIYAIKVMNKQKIKESQMEEQIVQEIKLQLYMNHPNILKLYGFFHDSKNIYLVLEYCNQCLFKQLRNKTRFSQEETAYYTKQCIASLKYMHNENIIHRDIKPENILIQNDVVKISDFGWSTYAPIYKRQTFCGTVDYVPPEIVQGNSYDQRVDIWAIGVLLYELTGGSAPFQTKDENITYDKIVNSQCKYPAFFSQQIKGLITKILDKNPSNRPNFDEIEKDQWFQNYKTTGRFIRKDIWAAWKNFC